MARYAERRQPFSRSHFDIASGIPAAMERGLSMRTLLDERARRKEEKALWDDPIQKEIQVGSGQTLPAEEVPIQSSPMPGGPQMSPVAPPATGLPAPGTERTSLSIPERQQPAPTRQIIDWDAMEQALSQKYMRLGNYEAAQQVSGMIQDQKLKGMGSSIQQAVRADTAGNFNGAAQALETLLDTADSSADYVVTFKDGNYVIMSGDKGADGEPQMYAFPQAELESYANRVVSAAGERGRQQEVADIQKTEAQAMGELMPTSSSGKGTAMTQDQMLKHVANLPDLIDRRLSILGEDSDLTASAYVDPARAEAGIASIFRLNAMGVDNPLSMQESIAVYESLHGPEVPTILTNTALGPQYGAVQIGPDSYVAVPLSLVPPDALRQQAASATGGPASPREKTTFERDSKLTPYEQLGRATGRESSAPSSTYEELGKAFTGRSQYGIPEDDNMRGFIQR